MFVYKTFRSSYLTEEKKKDYRAVKNTQSALPFIPIMNLPDTLFNTKMNF